MEIPRPGPAPAAPPVPPFERPVPLVSPADLVNPMLTVADVATFGPRTCSPASTVLEAVMVFRDAGCGLVPIVEDGRAIGVLTDRDVALALAEHEDDLAAMPVRELMSREVASIDSSATLGAAFEMLENQGVRRLLATGPDGRLVGVLSWSDLAPHLSERAIGRVVSSILEGS